MPEMTTVFLGVLAGFATVVAGLVLFSVWTAWRVEKALPPHGKFLQLTGARIHYLEHGSGQAIVMVHGLGGQSSNFTYGLVDRLAREYRVIVVDRPGAGYSTRESDDSARLRSQAAIVADFIRKLGLDRPVVVGHSLGGAIALAVALDFPDAIGGLALLAPLTHVPKQVPAPFRPLDIPSKWLRSVVSWTLGVPIGIRRGPAIVKMIFAPEAVPKDFATRGGGLLSLRPWNFYNVSTDLVAADADLPGMIEQYPRIRVPVAILYGTSDEVLDCREHGEAMKAKIPNLRLKFVEGGHMLPVTQPELAAEFIRESARVMCAPPHGTVKA
jgi:pimeloyl-ACP methyl ester carboxylesterase